MEIGVPRHFKKIKQITPEWRSIKINMRYRNLWYEQYIKHSCATVLEESLPVNDAEIAKTTSTAHCRAEE